MTSTVERLLYEEEHGALPMDDLVIVRDGRCFHWRDPPPMVGETIVNNVMMVHAAGYIPRHVQIERLRTAGINLQKWREHNFPNGFLEPTDAEDDLLEEDVTQRKDFDFAAAASEADRLDSAFRSRKAKQKEIMADYEKHLSELKQQNQTTDMEKEKKE